MIQNNFSEILGRKRLKVSDVCEGTGLARNTVSDFYYDRSKRIDFETLNRLCSFLDCQPGDIMVYVNDKGTE